MVTALSFLLAAERYYQKANAIFLQATNIYGSVALYKMQRKQKLGVKMSYTDDSKTTKKNPDSVQLEEEEMTKAITEIISRSQEILNKYSSAAAEPWAADLTNPDAA